MSTTIRAAKLTDARRIRDIYAPYIENTPITFEVDVPSVEEFERYMTGVLRQHPWLVCEVDGEVAGYAYACEHRPRKAYDWSCNASIYLDGAFTGQGIGTTLYTALLKCLTAQGYHTVIAGIAEPNPPSTGLHTSFGFRKVGTYERVGFKLGAWHSVSWYQLELQNGDNPAPPVAFKDIANTIFL